MSVTTDTRFTYPYSSPTRHCTFRPFLHTTRLTLEILDDTNPLHIATGLQLLNDPISISMMGDFGIRTPAQYLTLLHATTLLPQHLPSGQPPSGSCCYLVRLGAHAPQGEIVGLISLASRHPEIPPDIGWAVLPAHHGRGYATEAAREVLRYVSQELQGGFVNARPKIGVVAWPLPSNIGSVGVARKLRMARVGELSADDGRVEVVFGMKELLDGRVFDKESDPVVNFYGPGELGQQCKAALEGS